MTLPATQCDASSDEDSGKAADVTPSTPSSTPPPTFDDIDRWRYHTDLRDFCQNLQLAANAVFPNDVKVFDDVYKFGTEHWTIPDVDSHYKLTEKVMAFVRPTSDKTQLKIVYYAGHARLMSTRTLAWTSWRNNKRAKCPMVKWSGIQTLLEKASCDVLILLDCCASGTANACEGNGVNELISACAWNETANGAGPYSFTSALVIELQRLSKRGSFSVGELYRNIFFRIQSRMPEDIPEGGRERERHPAPMHLVLTQEFQTPRSIQLSVHIPQEKSQHSDTGLENVDSTIEKQEHQSKSSPPSPRSGPLHQLHGTSRPPDDRNPSQYPMPLDPNVPKLLLAIRLRDTFKPDTDMVELFLEWLRYIPTIADGIQSLHPHARIFATISVGLHPNDPAIISLGPITSGNMAPGISARSVAASATFTPLGEITNAEEKRSAYLYPPIKEEYSQRLASFGHVSDEASVMPLGLMATEEQSAKRPKLSPQTYADFKAEDCNSIARTYMVWSLDLNTEPISGDSALKTMANTDFGWDHKYNDSFETQSGIKDLQDIKRERQSFFSAESLRKGAEEAARGAMDQESSQPICQNCSTSPTPIWRRDESGSVICNACGLFSKLHGRPRPISLKADASEGRGHVKTSGLKDSLKIEYPSEHNPTSKSFIQPEEWGPPAESEEDTNMSEDEYKASGSKMTDEEKRKNFLERNRIAALKCRQRKKQWLANLQQKVELYSQENDQLNAQLSSSREETENLKTILLAHEDCSVSKQQGLWGVRFMEIPIEGSLLQVKDRTFWKTFFLISSVYNIGSYAKNKILDHFRASRTPATPKRVG
ncbi:Transcription factor atf1 [Lachnellula suecica]|uniref:Transcription factor atf1 n=1 Tax=Lachnellula suecica TaxID=602035 RepID=A0A8T9CKA5_9HELO|nr:Transcription factor atf1 [Lachnellula suecica]